MPLILFPMQTTFYDFSDQKKVSGEKQQYFLFNFYFRCTLNDLMWRQVSSNTLCPTNDHTHDTSTRAREMKKNLFCRNHYPTLVCTLHWCESITLSAIFICQSVAFAYDGIHLPTFFIPLFQEVARFSLYYCSYRTYGALYVTLKGVWWLQTDANTSSTQNYIWQPPNLQREHVKATHFKKANCLLEIWHLHLIKENSTPRKKKQLM